MDSEFRVSDTSWGNGAGTVRPQGREHKEGVAEIAGSGRHSVFVTASILQI